MRFPPHPVQHDVGKFCQRCIRMTGDGNNHRSRRPRDAYAVKEFERRSRMRNGNHHIMWGEKRCRRCLLMCIAVCLNDHPEPQEACLYIPANRGRVAEPIDGDAPGAANLVNRTFKRRRIEKLQRILQSLSDVAKNLLYNQFRPIIACDVPIDHIRLP